jgi:hypothetical protein
MQALPVTGRDILAAVGPAPFTRRLLPGLCLALVAAGCSEQRSTMDAGTDARRADLAPRDATPDAVDPAPFKPLDLPLSRLACLAYNLSTGTTAAAEARRQADIKLLREAGIGTLRSDYTWHRIEKQRGSFDYGGYDARLRSAEAAGLEQIAILAYGNPWASTRTTSDPYYPPDDPADFARFVKTTVARYRGRITTWEIWNEPNAGYRFWKTHPRGDPRAFGALLKAAHAAAWQADPAARVLFGGPFYHQQLIPGHLTFLADAYRAHPDLGRHFDAMALHPYAYYPPGVPPEQDSGWEQPVGLMLQRVRALMGQHGDGQKPIYTTEVGWPVWSSVSEQQQARYLVRAFLLLAAAGARSCCWYTLRDADGHGVPTEASFGLLAYDSDPTDARPTRRKPSFSAYEVLLQTLGGHRLTADLRAQLALPPGTFAYRLAHATSGRRATALWSVASAGATVDLPLAAGTARVTQVGMLGARSQPAPSGGKLRLRAGPDPVYILEQ